MFIRHNLRADTKEIDPDDPGPYYTPLSTLRQVTSGAVEFTEGGAAAPGNNFVDTSGLADDDICQVCHVNAHYYNTGAATDSHIYMGANSQPGGRCTACHLHTAGFSAQGESCDTCHAYTLTDRRQVMGTGGDFERTSHHVTDSTTTEIVATEDCTVCHNQDNHQLATDPQVRLNDHDLGASSIHVYDGTGASVEDFCLGCHDADGPLAYDSDGDPGDGYQPFTDGRDAPDIETGWASISHNSAAGVLGSEKCLACHGGEDASISETVTDHDVHGSANPKLISKPAAGETVASPEEDNICRACRDADGQAATDIEAQITKNYAHDPSLCRECHLPHATMSGTHIPGDTASNPASGVLSGVSGIAAGTKAEWTVPALTEKGTIDYEYELCYRCHSSWTTLPPDLTDQSVEFNPQNTSFHWVEHDKGAPAAASNTGYVNGFAYNSKMYCSDCHKDDTVSTPKGPHGSNTEHLLGVQEAGHTQWSNLVKYQTDSASNFCLNCHDLTTTNFRSSTRNLHTAKGRHANQTCQTCHVAVPHGWYRYRFLVTTADPAPYKSDQAKIGSFTIPVSQGDWQRANCSSSYMGCHS